MDILIGDKFGDWIVIDKGIDRFVSQGKNKNKLLSKTWKCKCQCGFCEEVIKDVLEKNLIKNKSLGCGLKHKINNKFSKKQNVYALTNEYGIGYLLNGKEFYFDLEDYDLIKNYCWDLHSDTNNSYIRAYSHTENNIHKYIFLHNLVSNNLNSNLVVDHIDGNTMNNRKYNIRICKQIYNIKNLKLYKTNKSGTKGVYYSKKTNKWIANIQCNKNKIHLGSFENIDDAIKVRKEAEIKYFGEYNREERYL